MEYTELLKEAKNHSDHGERVQEFEPAIIESLQNTDAHYPALEIGNRDGGSGILIMWHIWAENKKRLFFTVDSADAPKLFTEYSEKLGVDWIHTKSSQKDYLRRDPIPTFGFVYLDADHDYANVKADLSILKLAKGAIVAVDDVNTWPEIPEIEGLERIDFDVDEGSQVGPEGHHIIFYRKL